MIKNIN